MIQEVFGGGSVGTPCPKTNATTTTTTTAVQSRETLRCPRCESINTKFCYYNNYNLTQPRHFCKTCRRYWTKGGTLRNVPIGGGCRKNRTPQTHASATSSSVPKPKATFSTQVLLNGFLDHPGPGPTPSPALWPSFPQGQSSHILSLLRGTTHDQFPSLNPNPSPSPNPNPNPLSFTTLGLDPYGNGAPYPLELNGFGLGGPDIVQNGRNGNNVQDLYQRWKSSGNYSYCGNEDTGEVILGNVVGSISSSSAMNANALCAASIGDYSSAISNWSEFPTIPIFGAFP